MLFQDLSVTVLFVTFFHIICPFADDIARPVLGFHVDFSDILADNAKADELNTSQGTHNTDHAGPAGNRIAAKIGYQGIQNADKAHR